MKTVLVTGATGQQGGAVLRALQKRGFAVRALTRDTASPKAAKLKAQGVEVVAGDLSDRASLDAAMRGAHGAFSIQTIGKKEGDEQRQGIAVAEAAAAAKVEHLVYSSVGGAERKSGIPHFESKFEIEEHIRKLGIPHTSSGRCSSWRTWPRRGWRGPSSWGCSTRRWGRRRRSS